MPPDSQGVLTQAASRTLRVLAFLAAIGGGGFGLGMAYSRPASAADASRLERVESKLDDMATRLARIEGKLGR